MSLAASLALAIALAAPLRANPQGGDQADSGQNSETPIEEQQAAAAAAAQSEAEAPAAPLSLDDARVNAVTVVQAFVARKSPKGYWPFREKGSKALYKLTLSSIDEKKIKELTGGRYGVPASLDDAEKKARLKMEFVVDLSGAEWKVVGMRLRKKEPLRGRKSAPESSRN